VLRSTEHTVSFSLRFVLGREIVQRQYCKKNRCKNGSSCKEDYANHTYKCYCRPGFYGRYCQSRKYSLYLHALAARIRHWPVQHVRPPGALK